MSNEIINDTTVTSAATDMAARAAEAGDHEAVVAIEEAVEKLVAETPAEPVTSGIAPDAGDVEVDLAGIKVSAPAPPMLPASNGVTIGGVATAIAKGVAAGATAKVIGDALPSDMHWAARLGITVTGGVLAATAVGAAIDAASGWFGKDTV